MNSEMYDLRVRVSDLIIENACLKREIQKLNSRINFLTEIIVEVEK